MKKYLDKSGNSGISHYRIGEDFIEVMFSTQPGRIYIYSCQLSGEEHIEQMKMLAEQGQGLSTYISQHPDVRDSFEMR